MSYPSPICAKRSPLINALLGLPNGEAVTQPPIPAEETAQAGNVTSLAPFWPAPGGVGIVDTPITSFPYTPIYPPGPGPIIFPPFPPPPPVGPNPPITPPIVPISGVPEPAAWFMMSFGFALTGGVLRRKARPYSGSQARSSPA